MAKVLDYDFERPWYATPLGNAEIAVPVGIASGGGTYVATEDPSTSSIVGVIASIVSGGASYALTHNRVFDKSGQGKDGFLKEGAHIEDTELILDGRDDYVFVDGFQTPQFSILSKITLAEIERYHGIMGRAASIWSDAAFAFRIDDKNRLRLDLSQNGTEMTYVRTTATMSPGITYRVAATFDRPTAAVYLYGPDSELIERNEVSWDRYLHHSEAPVIVGGYAYGNGLNYLMHGEISKVEYYDEELTEDEIGRRLG